MSTNRWKQLRSLLIGFGVLTSLILSLVASGCASTNPQFNPQKKHHTTTGFTNNYGPAGGKPLGELLRWTREASKQGLPKPPSQLVNGYTGFKVIKPNVQQLVSYTEQFRTAFAANPSDAGPVTITFIGHATVLVQMAGLNILTDPHFGERASPVSFAGPKRMVPLPVQLEELPRIDLVLLSHNHYDHLDTGTINRLKKQEGGEPLFLIPIGLESWFKSAGVSRFQSYDWWDHRELGNLRRDLQAHFVPAQHWSTRSPFDRNASLWGGWVLEYKGFKFYFAGDTGYSRDFADIAAKFGAFDLSLIPIGAYEPRWFMKDQHVNPDEAVQIHRDVKSKFSIGVHWGSFDLTDESLDQPLIDLRDALQRAGVPSREFQAFEHGQQRTIR